MDTCRCGLKNFVFRSTLHRFNKSIYNCFTTKFAVHTFNIYLLTYPVRYTYRYYILYIYIYIYTVAKYRSHYNHSLMVDDHGRYGRGSELRWNLAIRLEIFARFTRVEVSNFDSTQSSLVFVVIKPLSLWLYIYTPVTVIRFVG